MSSLEKGRLWGDLITAFQYINRRKKNFLHRQISIRIWRNGFEWKEEKFRFDVGGKFFTERVMRRWHRMPRKIVVAPTMEAFKARLDRALGSLIWCLIYWLAALPMAEGWN